jgi:hypothetical protein
LLISGGLNLGNGAFQLLGSPAAPAKRPPRKCTVSGCRRPHLAKGLCGPHYAHMRKYGSLYAPQSPNAYGRRLSENQVRQIRKLRAGGLTVVGIAKLAGTSRSNVSLICRGKTWGHVKKLQGFASMDPERRREAIGLGQANAVKHIRMLEIEQVFARGGGIVALAAIFGEKSL